MAEISETKTPQPGEWWVRNQGGRIFYICGFDPDGCPVHWNDDVGFYVAKMLFFCREFHYEPRCTGFDWIEPPEDPNDIPLNPVPGKLVATGTINFNMAAIIAEHTQQVRELTQRIGELAQQVNERDAMLEKIRTTLRMEFAV